MECERQAPSKGQIVYAMGGSDGASSLNVNEAYNIASDSWSTNTSLPTPRMKAGTHSHGGRVYVVGGASANGASTNANEVFKP